MQEKIVELVSGALGIRFNQVKSTIELLNEGATIPFISRYRKERTGGLDEVQIGDIDKLIKKYNELEARKETIINAIEEQGKLTPELKTKIINCYNANELEDIYLPYKRRKKTRADLAREKGLENLAKIIMSQKYNDIKIQAGRFLTDEVKNEEEAIDGAKDIIAEWVNENQVVRDMLRNNFRKFALINSSADPKKKQEAIKYTDYFDFRESLLRCPSHRFLAMMRGSNEGVLKVGLVVDEERTLNSIERKFIHSHGKAADLISEAIEDGYKRLIFPSVENQILNEFKEKADDEAILVFTKNLRQLLLAPPLGQKAVLAIDPGFRTGCKVVALDSNGGLLENQTIFPHEPVNKGSEAEKIILELVAKYDLVAIAIGNGTASRETKFFVDGINFKHKPEIYIVSESGASIYSASDIARQEFPNKDVTVRGAISIGRRLIDPLSELVKIDPKSIGVGQYQHDVNQAKLKDSLGMTVESCVNRVGVNLNTATEYILTYIAGLGPGLAKNIIEYRVENGNFTDIRELKKVKRLGEKAFEQSAGFLRIRDGKNILDNTGVHPESYPVVMKMAKSVGLSVESFVDSQEVRKKVSLSDFVTDKTGLPTLTDIMKELEKPGLDPRGKAKQFDFDPRVKSIADVISGMMIPGKVTNMTNFGAFVDIGAGQDGLIHISQITDKFIKNPDEVLSLGQELLVKVLDVDIDRKRINLTLLF